MFERFTEPARRALFFARAKTSQRRGDSITPEDLLGGILWVVPDVIVRLSSGPATMVAPMEAADDYMRLTEDDGWVAHSSKEIPFSDAIKLVLIRSCEEADALGHEPVRPEHLILGLLREEGSEAWGTLRRAGVTLREARRILGEEPRDQS
jgi:ATP-dependent Clp protease ATP-binding subunit ClpA